MPILSRLDSLRRNLFARRRVERDLDDELRACVDQLAEENRAAGMEPAEALRAARIELGGLEQVKEDVRQARAGRLVEELVRDVRYGARTLRKNPAFTAVAVPMRCVFALTAMGFVPEPPSPEEVVRVRVLPAWLRIDARFGSVFRRRGDPALVLR